MSITFGVYPHRSSTGFLLEFILEILRDPKWRRIILIFSIFVTGSYMLLTQDGEIQTERIVFVGWDVQGYGYYTTGFFDVCTDPMNEDETTFHLYRHSLGSWSPIDHLDRDDDMDIDAWYIITYQKTLLGNKLIKVEYE